MKIHTDTLSVADFNNAARETGTILANIESAGSRSRRSAFNIYLSGSHSNVSRHTVNGEYIKAATYDEWGHFLAYIYDRDHNAICGVYKDKGDFHHKTEWNYDTD